MSGIQRFAFNKILAQIEGTPYRVKKLKIDMQVNSPTRCDVTIAQGANRKGKFEGGSANELDKTYQGITIELYMENKKEPVILFRGFISGITREASRNPNGSFVGLRLLCLPAITALSAAKFQAYRYWGNKNDGKGFPTALANADFSQISGELDKTEQFVFGLGGTNSEEAPEPRFEEDAAKCLVGYMDSLINLISRGVYTGATKVHILDNGTTVQPGGVLANSSAFPEKPLMAQMKQMFRNADAFSILMAMATGTLMFVMAPSPCGKYLIIPEFPWAKEALTTLERSDILEVYRLSQGIDEGALVDAVFVPVLFGQNFEPFVSYPAKEDLLETSGIAKPVQTPAWMDPWLGLFAEEKKNETEDTQTDITKTKKKGPKTLSDKIKEVQNQQYSLAESMAQMAYNRLKSAGSVMQVRVPWYRLEFLDALGYLIKIANPSARDVDKEEDDIYGYLAGATFSASSTTGGSEAGLVLSFSHVRGESKQDTAFTEHPFWIFKDEKFRQAFQTFMAKKKDRMYDRGTQKGFEGGAYDGYLKEVKSIMGFGSDSSTSALAGVPPIPVGAV
jgi:hypothetical protein